MSARPAKRGDYVRLRGERHCVTGVNQQAEVTLIMRDRGIPTAPITRWDGHAWSDTGTVMHAATPDCQVHDADDPIPGRICGGPTPCPDHP